MLKRLGLSAAVILASAGLAAPVMAADRDDFHGRDNHAYNSGYDTRYTGRDQRDYRGDNRYEERTEHERFERRARNWNEHDGFRFTLRFGDHDRDDWR